MAERRMFAKTIIESDAFLDMPHSSQLLYFHLAMRGDDDGFINNPKAIMRNVKCNDDDIKLLIAKKFIIPFESGVVVIKHWKIHNYIAKDRYKETKYKTEKALLSLDENNSYTQCIQPVYEMDTQVRLGEVSKDKDNISCGVNLDEPSPKPKRKKAKPSIPPTVEEVAAYCKKRENGIDAEEFVDFYTSKGWMIGKTKMQDWQSAVRTWERKRKNEGSVNNGASSTNDTARIGEGIGTWL